MREMRAREMGRWSSFNRPAIWGWFVFGGLLLGNLPSLAERPDRPPYYAIENVTVLTGAGETLERATVLLADGLIEAVGRSVAVPADAWVIDGEGLLLYPGLIDTMTGLGQKASGEEAPRPATPEALGGRPRGDRPQVRGPEDRPATTPWKNAADHLTMEDSRIEKWREMGFTSVVTSPKEGFFAGQAALINLGDEEPREMVVTAPVAQRLNFNLSRRSRAFPGSLMGRISYVKQVFSDAQHYALANQLYEESPLGRSRPMYDRTLDPVREAVARRLPFLMPAHIGREIDRALEIAEQYDLRPILYGGQGAYERLAELRASKTPVLMSLDWPEADRDRDPEADTPFRSLYHRQMAPVTPNLLAEAGVPFAFYSDGLSSTSKIRKGLRAAVDAGLSQDDALEALTLGAARILGVDDRLGSVAVGKIANLVLATDVPWSEDAEIRAVFVDGEKYRERGDMGPTEPPASNVGGTWDLKMQTPRGEREATLRLEMTAEGKVSGDYKSTRSNFTLEKGRMSGDQLSFKVTRTLGERTFEATYYLTVTGDELEGRMSAGSFSMDILGERKETAPIKEPGARRASTPPVSLEELERVMEKFWGPRTAYDVLAITNARVYTLAGETIEKGTVLVEEGKIRAVGQDVKIPRNATVIDAEGGSLIPGIIDAHSHIAVEGGVNEGSLAVTSMVTIQDVINPDDVAIYRALAGGVTAINVLHGSANPIGGGNAVLKLRWGKDAEGLRFDGAPPGIKFALGENPKRSRSFGSGPQRYPATRMGVMDVIRQAFNEAREYQKEWQSYEKAVAGGEKPTPPRRDFKLERLVEILEGDRLVHTHCYRADEILQLLRLAEEFDFQVATLQHVLEGYKVADEIAAHGAGASTFSDWWGYKVEAYDAIPHNAALMTERGVVVSINSDSGEEMRHLNQEAAKAMKWGGLDEIEALKLVTLNPAKQLRIDDRVGSIEVGKDADLVLYDGPPLSMFSVVRKTFVDGVLYFDREADEERQAAIEDVKAKLLPSRPRGGGSSRPAASFWETLAEERSGTMPRWSEPAYSCEENH